jgi:hypothetical protein
MRTLISAVVASTTAIDAAISMLRRRKSGRFPVRAVDRSARSPERAEPAGRAGLDPLIVT